MTKFLVKTTHHYRWKGNFASFNDYNRLSQVKNIITDAFEATLLIIV